jgi:hypothetical protein
MSRPLPAELQQHLHHCSAACGLAHHLAGWMHAVHAALRPRFVSTLVVLLLVMTGMLWML